MFNSRSLLFYSNCRMTIFSKICKRHLVVLGIETSCDDTGISIVDSNRNILANVVNTQQTLHTRYGGIIPPRAQDLHRRNIEQVLCQSIQEARMDLNAIDAIAVTTTPGLPLSLLIGVRYAKYLARTLFKPLISVHHMEAHALAVRMEYQVEFPFLCLLISGGHCQLVLVRGPSNFYLLGQSLDDSPGEAFDKIARRLRLFTIPMYKYSSGGQAIEHAAKESKYPNIINFPSPLKQYRNCQFSFAGIKNNAFRHIRQEEKIQGTPPDSVIRNYKELCAGLIRVSSKHLAKGTQRALEFSIEQNFFKNKQRTLVLAGGVANNDLIFHDISLLASYFNFKTYRPTKRLCSDNGAMIAWNAVEKILDNKMCLNKSLSSLKIQGKSSLGSSIEADIEHANIKCQRIKTI